jgi:hypothetical protein
MVGHGFARRGPTTVNVTVTSMMTLASPVVSIVGAWMIFSQALEPLRS